MTTEGTPTPTPPQRARFPIFGCAALVVLIAVAGALAAGGSFWGWVITGALALIGGIAIVVIMARQNRKGGGFH